MGSDALTDERLQRIALNACAAAGEVPFAETAHELVEEVRSLRAELARVREEAEADRSRAMSRLRMYDVARAALNQERERAERYLNATREFCSCGGMGLEDEGVCVACRIYHAARDSAEPAADERRAFHEAGDALARHILPPLGDNDSWTGPEPAADEEG